MKLPKQLPAVERNASKNAVVPEGAHMNPSAWYDDALDLGVKYGPGIVKGLGSLF